MIQNIKKYFLRFSDFTLKALGTVCAVAMAGLTFSVLWGVATRYILGAQAPFTEELARMLLIVVTFFGGAYAFGKGAHIGLDFLASHMEKSARILCISIAAAMSIIFSIGVLTYGGVRLIETSMQSANRLISMPIYMWQIYLCVPVSGILSTVFLIARLMRREGFDVSQEEVL